MLKTEFEFYEILYISSKMLFPYLSRFRNYTEKRQITGRKYSRHIINKTSSERDIWGNKIWKLNILLPYSQFLNIDFLTTEITTRDWSHPWWVFFIYFQLKSLLILNQISVVWFIWPLWNYTWKIKTTENIQDCKYINRKKMLW